MHRDGGRSSQQHVAAVGQPQHANCPAEDVHGVTRPTSSSVNCGSPVATTSCEADENGERRPPRADELVPSGPPEALGGVRGRQSFTGASELREHGVGLESGESVELRRGELALGCRPPRGARPEPPARGCHNWWAPSRAARAAARTAAGDGLRGTPRPLEPGRSCPSDPLRFGRAAASQRHCRRTPGRLGRPRAGHARR
jgi:hypothetical protein